MIVLQKCCKCDHLAFIGIKNPNLGSNRNHWKDKHTKGIDVGCWVMGSTRQPHSSTLRRLILLHINHSLPVKFADLGTTQTQLLPALWMSQLGQPVL